MTSSGRMDRSGRCVIAIFGPTGSGKTALAVEVAHRLGIRVISADSMQLYRGFPILTNQPTAQETARAQHELVAVAEPEEQWSVSVYAERAAALLAEDLATGGRALLAGGTGLYVRAALAPLGIPDVHAPELRKRLNQEAEELGPEALYARLAELDPAAARAVDPHNPRRIVRALEVVMVRGPGSWPPGDELWRPQYRFPTLLVGLDMDRGELYRRIELRAAAMVAGGAVDEVHRYWESCGGVLPEGAGVTKAMGFKETLRFLQGELDEEQLVERLAAAHRRYARAQLTWLRKLEDVVIMDPSAKPVETLAQEVLMRAEEKADREKAL
ncbi:MAG: tRNA (adenosine(37)-N6)-dimethylallyltransferase MiaA [Thermoleophilia bacterium]